LRKLQQKASIALIYVLYTKKVYIGLLLNTRICIWSQGTNPNQDSKIVRIRSTGCYTGRLSRTSTPNFSYFSQLKRYSVTRNVYKLRALVFSLGLNNPPLYTLKAALQNDMTLQTGNSRCKKVGAGIQSLAKFRAQMCVADCGNPRRLERRLPRIE
jgi:hypothetical protein